MQNSCERGREGMKKELADWLMVGLIFLVLIGLFMFVQARSPIVTGRVLDYSFFEQTPCVSYSEGKPVAVNGRTLNLCGNQTHSVDYFELFSNETTIRCNGSTISGNGGALFVARIPNPKVSLQNCVVENFDGFYQNKNPVDVRIE